MKNCSQQKEMQHCNKRAAGGHLIPKKRKENCDYNENILTIA
jgi:hypothetical protein